MQDWVLWSVAGAAALGGLAAGVAWFTRRQKQAHVRRVAAALAQACDQAEARIREDQSSGAWDRSRAATLKQLRRVLASERRALKQRIDAQVDGDFFKCALFASVGRHPRVDRADWVAEFDARSSGVVADVLRTRAVTKRCAAIVNQELAPFQRRWVPTVSDADAQASSDVLLQQGLPALECDDRLLDALTNVGALGGVVLSGMALSAGLPVKALELTGKVLTSDIFQDLVLTWVFDELVETVGEEIIEEVVTSIAAAFTGIGALFTLYKMGKWGWKLKKLLVDQEHLVELRAQIHAACLEEHKRLEAHVLGQVARELDRTPTQALQRVTRLAEQARAVA